MIKNTSNHNIWDKIINEFNEEKLKYILVGAAAKEVDKYKKKLK
ncbi:MAG: hypothetical protein ABH872_01780 [Candidatus Omnitrophota bacterium]